MNDDLIIDIKTRNPIVYVFGIFVFGFFLYGFLAFALTIFPEEIRNLFKAVLPNFIMDPDFIYYLKEERNYRIFVYAIFTVVIPMVLHFEYKFIKLFMRAVRNRNIQLAIKNEILHFYTTYYDSLLGYDFDTKIYNKNSPRSVNLSNSNVEISDTEISLSDKDEMIVLPNEILSPEMYNTLKSELGKYSTIEN